MIIPCQDPEGSAVTWEEGGLVVLIYGTGGEVSVTQKAAMVRDRRRAGRTGGCHPPLPPLQYPALP